MELLTLTYKITPEKAGGFCVQCLDWRSVFTQGETLQECKKNAIEATELMLQVLNEGNLDPAGQPKIKSHRADPFQFQLTFELEKAKFISLHKINKRINLHIDSRS